MKRKSLKVDLKIPEINLEVRGSREDLRTAFSNLLDNAVKFSPVNGDVSISVERTPEGVCLRCENSVLPTNRADTEKMFESFYRGVQDEGSGTGLGLAIVKKVVENHSDTIKSERTGNHMKMYVLLPLLDIPSVS
jgi:signal transduction histidine kinase